MNGQNVGDGEKLSAIEKGLGLSPAESKVTLALSKGQEIHQISEAHGVSIHTVRAQLRSIFEKTGAKTQIQLIVRVFKLIGFNPEE